MKRTLVAVLVAGLFAGAATFATAQNVSAADQPAKNATQADPAKTDATARSSSKADYDAAADKAQSQYKDAKAKCDSLKGDPMRECMTNATTARTDALALAKTQSEGGADANATDDTAPAKDGMGKDDAGNAPAQPKYPK